jgi:hypothetical protein
MSTGLGHVWREMTTRAAEARHTDTCRESILWLSRCLVQAERDELWESQAADAFR